MVPSILPGAQPKYLSLWQGSCYRVLSQVIFRLFWDTLFWFFLSIPVVWWCQLPISPSICRFPFLRTFWWLLDLVVWLLLLCVICPFSLLAWCIFLCQIPFLYLDCIFSQFVLGFPIRFRFWQKVWCRQVVDIFLRFTEFISGCAFPWGVIDWHRRYHK